MSIHSKWKKFLLGVCVFAVVALLALGGCQAQQTQSEETTVNSPLSGDTATKGEYDSFDPEKGAEETGGEAIEGSEEEELQQERIAGGAVGGVVSKNLEPLTGITDSSEGPYVPNYGINLQAPPMGHGDNGSDCMSCHKDGGQGAVQPKSHTDSKLTNEDCVTCHSLQGS